MTSDSDYAYVPYLVVTDDCGAYGPDGTAEEAAEIYETICAAAERAGLVRGWAHGFACRAAIYAPPEVDAEYSADDQVTLTWTDPDDERLIEPVELNWFEGVLCGRHDLPAVSEVTAWIKSQIEVNDD